MDRTDRLMAGVKRTLDEMRACLLNNLLHDHPNRYNNSSRHPLLMVLNLRNSFNNH